MKGFFITNYSRLVYKNTIQSVKTCSVSAENLEYNMPSFRVEGSKTLEKDGIFVFDFFCSGNQFYELLSPYICFISFFIS